METPSISLRRHPGIAFIILASGIVTIGIGLYFGEFWVVFMGVLPVIIATMLMLNPLAVITDHTIELRNVFGLAQASYDHDGFHLLHVQNDVLYIQRGDMHAALRRLSKSRVHGGDWAVMLKTIAHAKQVKSTK